MEKLNYIEDLQLVVPLWSEEDMLELIKAFESRHEAYLDPIESFDIELTYNEERLQIRTTLVREDGLEEYPVEGVYLRDMSECLQKKQWDPKNIAFLLLDYLETYWAEYFSQERDVFLPIDWSRHECEGVTFYLRGCLRKTELEQKADALLAEHGHGAHAILPRHKEGV